MILTKLNAGHLVCREAGVKAKIDCVDFTEYCVVKNLVLDRGQNLIDPMEIFEKNNPKPFTRDPKYYEKTYRRTGIHCKIFKFMHNNPLTLYFNSIKEAESYYDATRTRNH